MTFLRRLMLVSVMLALCTETNAREEPLPTVKLDIAAQPISDALLEFSRQAGIQVVFDSKAGQGISAPRVAGRFTAPAALTRLLANTGLEFEYLNDRTVAVRRAGETAQEVGAAASPAKLVRVTQAEDASMDSAPAAGQVAEVKSKAQEFGRNSANEPFEEIVVTAQKREQNLVDVPISITALSGEELENARIGDMQNLAFAVPGMSVASYGAGRDIIAIRGLGSERGSSSLTGVYLDEMPVTGAQNGFVAAYIDLRPVDLERVEVLKGPQGTLFGEGSVGGTVRFITNDPQFNTVGGKVLASAYDTVDGGMSQEVVGVLNLPVVENKFAVRIAGLYENRAGWIDEVSSDGGPVFKHNINSNEAFHIRTKALWTPSESLTLKAMATVHRNDGGGSNVVNQSPLRDSNFLTAVDPRAPNDFTDDYDLYNLTASYDLGFAQLLSSTSYGNMESTASLSQVVRFDPAVGISRYEILMPTFSIDSSIFSQELRLSSAGQARLNWTVGAFYKDAKTAYTQGRDGYSVNVNGAVSAGLAAGSVPTQKSASWAVFADTSYSLSNRLEIGAGLRYFEDDRESYNASDSATTFSAEQFDAVTFRTHLSFALMERAKIYVSVADGFRSGGFNGPVLAARGAPATYDPETTTSYELGTKMALAGGRLNIEAAVFYSEYTDIQADAAITRSPVDGQYLQFTSNSGEAEMRGFEWSLLWAATRRLKLGFSGDVTDTKLTKGDASVLAPPAVVGDPINFVPDYSLAFNADYGLSWSPSVPGFVRVQYNEQGKSAATLRGLGLLNSQDVTPILHFLNASVGADFANGWSAELFGQNLLDEEGSIRPGYSGITSQARPLTVGVRVAKSF